jgi:hypothetical protein
MMRESGGAKIALIGVFAACRASCGGSDWRPLHRKGRMSAAHGSIHPSDGGACLKLLPRHRKVEPFLGCDEVIVAVLADIQLHPLDLTGEAVARRAVIR